MVIGFNEHLENVTTAVTLIHTLCSSLESVRSLCCNFTGCRLVTASNIVASSASVFTFLLAGDYVTTNYIIELSCL
jgi:hypothetical protein